MKTGKIVPNLMAEMYPGRKMKDLSKDELRAYHREYNRRGGAVQKRRERYERDKEKIRAAAKAYRAALSPERIAKQREYEKRWKERNKQALPYYYKRYRLRVAFGLTMEQYADMLRAQNGRCALCSRADSGRKKWEGLVVDHCHATGKVRALLCHQCNMVLGHSQDNPALLRRTADYVEAHAGR